MPDDPKVREAIVGPYGVDDRAKRHHEAMSQLLHGVKLVGRRYELTDGDILALLCGVAACVAEQVELKEDLSQIMEAWVPLLRSEKPIMFSAEGNA